MKKKSIKKSASKRTKKPAKTVAKKRAKAAAVQEIGNLGSEEGRNVRADQASRAKVIAEIRETHRRRQDFLRAEIRLTLQSQAIACRMCKGAIKKHLAEHGAARLADIHLPGFTPGTLKRAISELKKFGAIAIVGGLLTAEGEATSPVKSRLSALDLPPLSDEQDDYAIDEGDGDGQVKGDDRREFATPVSLATLPFTEAESMLRKRRLNEERRLKELAAMLPVASFVESVHGFGLLGLAQIVGECGDLSNYDGPAKVWKRMGLAVINGKSQRRVTGAGALEQGYSPQRRSIMFTIVDSLLKQQNVYREIYLGRKQYEVNTATAAGLTVAPAAKIPKARAAEYRSLGHIDKRAARYAGKRLLRDLWRAWRNQSSRDTLYISVSPRPSEPAAMEMRA